MWSFAIYLSTVQKSDLINISFPNWQDTLPPTSEANEFKMMVLQSVTIKMVTQGISSTTYHRAVSQALQHKCMDNRHFCSLSIVLL